MFKKIATGSNIIYAICMMSNEGISWSMEFNTVDELDAALTIDLIRENKHVTVTSENIDKGLILDVICIK